MKRTLNLRPLKIKIESLNLERMFRHLKDFQMIKKEKKIVFI